MTRKLFLLSLCGIAKAAVPPEPQALDAGNEFARLYNIWAQFRRQTGTVVAGEIRAWKAVRKAWKRLDRTIHYE